MKLYSGSIQREYRGHREPNKGIPLHGSGLCGSERQNRATLKGAEMPIRATARGWRISGYRKSFRKQNKGNIRANKSKQEKYTDNIINKGRGRSGYNLLTCLLIYLSIIDI